MGRVVVVGSVNRDRVVRCTALPSPGETVVALGSTYGFGGKGGNQACAAARFGADTMLVGAIGADAAGHAAAADMRRHGVDVSRLAVLDGVRTGAADVFVDACGENFIVVEPGANLALSPCAVEDALSALEVSAADVVLTSGEISADAVAAAAEQARCAGATHVHNLAPFRPLEQWGDGEHLVLVANALEARQATAVADPTASAIRLACGRRAALVTLGAQGALLAMGAKVLSLTAPQVTAVDTTGAGDALCGAFAAALALGIELDESAALAVLAGAVAVTGAGARGALANLANLT